MRVKLFVESSDNVVCQVLLRFLWSRFNILTVENAKHPIKLFTNSFILKCSKDLYIFILIKFIILKNIRSTYSLVEYRAQYFYNH